MYITYVCVCIYTDICSRLQNRMSSRQENGYSDASEGATSASGTASDGELQKVCAVCSCMNLCAHVLCVVGTLR